MCEHVGPVTILDCAVARGAKADEGSNSFTMGDIEAVGLPFFGGCQVCHANIACYNAYPSKTNYLRCRSCIGDLGFATTGEFEVWCMQFDHDELPDDDGDVDELGNRICEDNYLVLGDELETEDIERAIDEDY
jgi:hypothetical protein